MRIVKGTVFVLLNVSVVGLYCLAMSGRLEPLKFEPLKFVTVPLMLLTAVVAVGLYPLLCRLRSRLFRSQLLYCGFVVISALYGVHLWIRFPDGSPWSVLVAVVGGHLYGWPPFLAVLLIQLSVGRWLFPAPDSR